MKCRGGGVTAHEIAISLYAGVYLDMYMYVSVSRGRHFDALIELSTFKLVTMKRLQALTSTSKLHGKVVIFE